MTREQAEVLKEYIDQRIVDERKQRKGLEVEFGFHPNGRYESKATTLWGQFIWSLPAE